MRVLSDSKVQPTHHSKKSGIHKKAEKGAVMVKTNLRGEYNAMKRCGNITINEIDHEKITSKNVGARQYKGVGKRRLDETTPVTSDAIIPNSDRFPRYREM